MRPFPSLTMMMPSKPPVVPATYYFTTVGWNYFIIPPYNTLIVKLWGGGAGATDGSYGSNGVSSLFYDGLTTPTAGGGEGIYPQNGGVASGGDSNLPGGAGSTSIGGSSPNGGTASSGVGHFPGGGAGATDGYGGGGAAFCQKTYSPGQLLYNNQYSLYVGSGGIGGYLVPSYIGANGEIIIIIA